MLKGHRTIIAGPEDRAFINLTGNPGMATGGTGDVLTGMIAAWFGQLLDAEAASKLAVYLHGAAGDLAEADEGEVSLTASDVAARISDAILELTSTREAASSRVTVRPRLDRAAKRKRPRPGSALGRSARRPVTSCCCYGELGAGQDGVRARPRAGPRRPGRTRSRAPPSRSSRSIAGAHPLPRRSLSSGAARSRRPRARGTRLDGVVAIEWAERWADHPRSARRIRIDDLGGDRRRLSLTSG